MKTKTIKALWTVAKKIEEGGEETKQQYGFALPGLQQLILVLDPEIAFEREDYKLPDNILDIFETSARLSQSLDEAVRNTSIFEDFKEFRSQTVLPINIDFEVLSRMTTKLTTSSEEIMKMQNIETLEALVEKFRWYTR